MKYFNPREWWKTVYVRPYTRYRFGKWENVIDHYRSRPGQGHERGGFN